MIKTCDAIVVGAGVAGSSCALQLASGGARTFLLDRQSFPRHKTCGEFMSPESKEMLEHLGIRLHDHNMIPSRMNHAKIVMSHGGEIETPLPGEARGISRYELDGILHEKAMVAGCEIVTQSTVTGIRKLKDHSYEVEAKEKGETVIYRSKAVIGAYGTKKPRNAKSIPNLRDEQVYVGIKSHYSGIDVPSRVELYFCNGGYVGLSPIERGKTNIAALIKLDAIQGSGKNVPEMLKAASRTNTKLAERLAEGSPVPETQVGVCPIRLSNVPEPWSDFPHVGDALLMIPPLCGDGMSIALRSSLLASRWAVPYLQGTISFAEWKSGYSDEANREFSQLLRRARRIQKLAFAKTNRIYPFLTRVFPGLGDYFVKATRLPEMKETLEKLQQEWF